MADVKDDGDDQPHSVVGTPRRRPRSGTAFPMEAFPWLLQQKVTIPDRPAGYLRRTELEERALPTHRRLTVLRASGGFGKTTLMAECCRRLRVNRVATAWVSLDEHDAPDVLDVYIAFSCASAGLNLLDLSHANGTAAGPESRVAAVMRKIESLGRPFVIAFDELERLRHDDSVSLLAFLLQRGPSNLHLMFAGRTVPDGLDVTSLLLDGRADALETEDLRFSRAEVARFFGLRLSRRAVANEIKRSAGWPVALRISQSTEREGEDRHDLEQRLAGNWIESRLLAHLGRDDRDFVLDVSLLDWLDEALLFEVLRRKDSMFRLKSMTALTGLLEPLGQGAARRWRLHPLVRDHCAGQRLREDAERAAAIHRRIAVALARRGRTVDAMRHAIEGNDPFLAASLLDEIGCMRLWMRQGVQQLQYVNQLLTDDALRETPRLTFLRCVALVLGGRADEARAVYRECPRTGFRSGGNALELDLFVNDCWARLVFAVYGGASPAGSDSSETLLRDLELLTTLETLDSEIRGVFEYGLAILHFLKAQFERTRDRLVLATEPPGIKYIVLYGELLHGQIDFVRGRPQDARSHFLKARRLARKSFLADPVAMTSCDFVLWELALECNSAAVVAEPPAVPRVLMSHGVPYSLFATACNVLIASRLRVGRSDEALAVTKQVLLRLRRAGLTPFVKLMAALRVSVLVLAGRATEAERAWRRETLPEEAVDCVDLTVQTWREMEAVSEARARLLIEGRRFDEARSLLRLLHSVAVDRGLRKVEMSAMALSVALEHQAGEPRASQRHLEEYLSLFAESPYAWPLVRDRTACASVLRTYVDSNPDTPGRQAARSLLTMCGEDEDERSDLSLNERELEILRRLEGRQDKEIAAELNLTTHGVRYHLRSLFKKLRVSRREQAVERGRKMALIPDDSRSPATRRSTGRAPAGVHP